MSIVRCWGKSRDLGGPGDSRGRIGDGESKNETGYHVGWVVRPHHDASERYAH
jgi:hypothetical protein